MIKLRHAKTNSSSIPTTQTVVLVVMTNFHRVSHARHVGKKTMIRSPNPGYTRRAWYNRMHCSDLSSSASVKIRQRICRFCAKVNGKNTNLQHGYPSLIIHNRGARIRAGNRVFCRRKLQYRLGQSLLGLHASV